jgi:hypothetical protein
LSGALVNVCVETTGYQLARFRERLIIMPSRYFVPAMTLAAKPA